MVVRSRVPRRDTSAVIPTRFSGSEVARIERAQALLGLRSRSAFIREAVLEKAQQLESLKVVEVRDVSEKEAVRMIDRYLAKHPGVHHVDDIADELGIELRVAFAAAEKLIDHGKAKVRGG